MYIGKEVSTGKKVAIKQISNKKVTEYGDKLAEAIGREIHVLKEVSKYDNPYLLKIMDFFESASNKYMVLEYCDSGDLQEKMFRKGAIPEAEALDIAYQIVLGLSALSELSIVHRDMKPENIFINDGVYKIGDFGFANQTSKF